MTEKQGLFIVFEGIDRCGKTTQSKKLQAYFLSKGVESTLTAEPTKSPVGKLLRKHLKEGVSGLAGESLDDYLCFLFACDRYHHLYNKEDGIIEETIRGRHIICDRYIFSSLAYQRTELVNRLNLGFPLPDLVFYLDLPVFLAVTRKRSVETSDIYETSEKLRVAKKRYDEYFAEHQKHPRGLKVYTLDATKQPEVIHQQVVTTIKQELGNALL